MPNGSQSASPALASCSSASSVNNCPYHSWFGNPTISNGPITRVPTSRTCDPAGGQHAGARAVPALNAGWRGMYYAPGFRFAGTIEPPRHRRNGSSCYQTRLTTRRSMFMDSIISRVILPGIGPVCPECLSRGHLPALRLSPQEVYSFGLTEPQSQLDWDVDAARALIAARPRTTQRLDPVWLNNWLTERTSVTAEHLDHIPADKLDEPAILVEIMACRHGAIPQPFRILI